MALGTDISQPSVKYGAAKELKFGCPESDDFDILESLSANANFGTDMQVKNEVGNTVGVVVGDPRIEITMNGISKKPPTALGALTEIHIFVTEVGSEKEPAESTSEKKFVIKSVKQDNSNEDFMKFELTGEHYYNCDYDQSKDLSTGEEEFGS